MSKTEIQRYIENTPIKREQLFEKTVDSEKVYQAISRAKLRAVSLVEEKPNTVTSNEG